MINVCPSANVAAPVEVVWSILSDPAQYGDWVDGRVDRVVPPGPLAVGQTIFISAPALGIRWGVRLTVQRVDPVGHQLEMQVKLPLGMQLHEQLACKAVAADACRVQFGSRSFEADMHASLRRLKRAAEARYQAAARGAASGIRA
jgi:hypothetical protein